VRLSGGDATVVLKSSTESNPEIISMRLVGRRSGVHATGWSPLQVRSNHYIGSDARQWKTGVASYARVGFQGVYRGVDLVYYGNQRQLEYDFVVRPGASPSDIAIAIDGAQKVAIDAEGDLVLTTKAGTLTHRAPVLYQDASGTREPVEGAYVMRPDGSVGFSVGEYDQRLPLVIDPVLSYSSYLGGAAQERIHGLAAEHGGAIVVVGETYSDDFPATTNALQPQRHAGGDAFVAKLTPTGDALMYATYVGGTSDESAAAVDLDDAGAAYVTGQTSSWDFPLRNAVQADRKGFSDSFVIKLDATGQMVYSTLLGGGSEEYGRGIEVDSAGRAHVAGATWSGDFPVVNGLQPALGGVPLFHSTDGGETWLPQAAGLRTSGVAAIAIDPVSPATIYAGTASEGVFKTIDGGATWTQADPAFGPFQVYALALGAGSPAALYAATSRGLLRSEDGAVSWSVLPSPELFTTLAVAPGSPATIYAAGQYSSGVMMSTDDGATWMQTGPPEAIVSLAVSGSTVYATSATSLFTSTAGSGWVAATPDHGAQINAVAVAPGNAAVAYVATTNWLFRTTTGGLTWEPLPALAGVPVWKIAIAPSDSSTIFVLSQSGGAFVSQDAGNTWRSTHSANVRGLAIAVHPGAPATAYIGTTLNSDGFVATLSSEGSTLEYSTYVGGSDVEDITDIAVHADGSRYVVGTTSSTDLPVLNATQGAFGGLWDIFAARITPEGSLGYSTYLGGWAFEFAPKVAVDAGGRAHIAGVTWSTNYPVVNAHQPQPGGGTTDVFVSVLNASGSGFVYSTYLGGSGMETEGSWGPDVAVTPAGETYVTGTTLSQNFPTTTDAFQPAHAGQSDVFLARFDAAGALAFSTLLGGAGGDYARAVTIDGLGAVTVAGYTSSVDFPTRRGLQPANAGSEDGFIATFTDGQAPVDTVPPVTTMSVSGVGGNSGWYRSQVTVTLSATDGELGSGVSVTQYRLENGGLQNYGGPLTISAQGTTRLTAQSTDVAGNVEVPAPATSIMIDTVTPALAIASPQAREYPANYALPVSVSAGDTTSGLAGPATVTVDGVPFTGGTLDLSTLALGPHTLVVSASDRAGNVSQSSVAFSAVADADMVIAVPADVTTIQAAIDRAISGETVLVSPGTYYETIDFRGKAITVASGAGPAETIIDGHGVGSVVSFRSGETRASVLSGFTIRGGLSTHSGGGVYVASSSPTIRGNVITANRSCTGVGIYSSFGSPLIEANRITGNAIEGCTGGWGIGIYIGGNSSAEIVDNEISDNIGGAASGGGIALFAAGNAVVRGNIIARNVTTGFGGCGHGGGIASANFAQAQIVNNLIVDNVACFGAGVEWGGSTGINRFVNNTIAGNVASVAWSGMYVSGFDARNELHNNIITAMSGPAYYCQNATSLSSPVLHSNNIFTEQGSAYGGSCASRTGLDGNISSDPHFLAPHAGDYRVRMEFEGIDRGNDKAPLLPATDVAKHERVFDGDADGTARVDMGALEYRNRAPLANAGPDRVIVAGTNCVGTVSLTAMTSDADGDAVSAVWTSAFGSAAGSTFSPTLPPGSHVLTLTVDDGNGGTATDTVTVSVVDVTAPVISSLTATPSVIDRSNHEMVSVVVTVSASGGCDATVRCRIVSVSSNEPTSGAGSGSSASDWEITGDLTLNVRAERSGKGSGRVYTIEVACSDAAGNRALSTVTVTVPR
jgi:hypothetical protein